MQRAVVLVLLPLVACAKGDGNAGHDLGGADLGVVGDLAGTDGANAGDLAKFAGLGCIENKSYCSQWNERSYCEDTPAGPVTKKEACPTGCFQGACSATACADECTLGAVSNLGTCKLWSLSQQAYVATDQAKLSDRAREHDKQSQLVTKTALGQMADATYTDNTHTTLAYYWGTADAALWSGSYLAAESWRLLATGARDAAEEVDQKVRLLHDDFKITGDVGYFARLAVPRSAAVPLEYNYNGQNYCADAAQHCNVDYKGTKWDWLGHTSRDAYTGVMLGLGMAYLATPDEELRKLIREDVTTVALELAKTRTFPVQVNLNGVPINIMATLENVILAPSEYVNGKVTVTLNTSGVSDTELVGAREFLPDFSTFAKQVIPFLTIPIPRTSSAMMLGGFFNIAMRASKGVPGYEATYQTLKTYYDAHVDSWLTSSESWTAPTGCDPSYFPIHIAYIMAYMWAALEEDPVHRARIADNVLQGKMWAAVHDHKNSYFAYLWGGTRPMSLPMGQQEILDANTQLAGFPIAPKGQPSIDHLADYPNDSSCMSQGFPASTVAVDVKDRFMDDSIWQRGVWTLKRGGDDRIWFPATDYLGAYWAARRYGFIADDDAGTCNRWAP